MEKATPRLDALVGWLGQLQLIPGEGDVAGGIHYGARAGNVTEKNKAPGRTGSACGHGSWSWQAFFEETARARLTSIFNVYMKVIRGQPADGPP